MLELSFGAALGVGIVSSIVLLVFLRMLLNAQAPTYLRPAQSEVEIPEHDGHGHHHH